MPITTLLQKFHSKTLDKYLVFIGQYYFDSLSIWQHGLKLVNYDFPLRKKIYLNRWKKLSLPPII